MISQNTIIADVKADLYANSLPDGFTAFLLGESARNDTPIRYYVYSSSSSGTDDGENIVKPTSVVGAGRWLKQQSQQIQADWGASTGQGVIGNKPTIPSAQIQSDWSQASSGATDYVKNKPSIPVAQQAYEGTTLRGGAFPIILSATVSSGVAVFNLTTNGLAGGTAIFSNGVIQDSINLYVNDATAAYQMGFVFSNANKTVTITANKLTTANILSGILGQAQANGSVIKLQIWGY